MGFILQESHPLNIQQAFWVFRFWYISTSRSKVLYINILDIGGMSMLFEPKEETFKKHLSTPFNVLVALQQLEKEEKLLYQKKEKLMESEQRLLVRISNILQFRMQRNKELKEQVEILDRNCDELEKFLRSLLIYYKEP
jgi:hypothetical protein